MNGPMFLHSLKMLLAPWAWNLMRGTVATRPTPTSPPLPEGAVIFACLHRDILPAILFVRSRRPVLLVSTSPDGEILIRSLGTSDYGFVRGQTGSQGARAVVELRRALEGGRSIGLAVDGPKGPYGSIQPGVLQLARLAGVPIQPLRAEAPGGLVLGTWDRTVVPRPFSSVTMVQGPVLRLSSDSSEGEMEEARQILADFFADDGEPA
jgi:lysophospholipid acyltransferase (LPLAT)-like uncharacterized protein